VVNVEWIVQYKIRDPEDWLFRIKEPTETIRDVSEATMRLVVGDSSATETLTARRREIADEVQKKLQEILDRYKAGISIQTVALQDAMPPREVQDSFNEVNRARQEMETTINMANKSYSKAIPEAEGEALKLIQEAEGYKLKRVNEARGDVSKFEKLLTEYQSSKQVTRRRLYLEAIEAVLPKLKHIYVLDEKRGGPLQLLDLKEALGGEARPAVPAAGNAAKK
jgi:membrane protease subunit HflK